MPRDDAQLSAAKRAYRTAAEVGNRQEEARWANVIGDILKNRGEYVEALKWLRIDYDISVKYLPEKQLLPTCQSLGEIYLRLQHFKDALVYQKKHLELAKDSDDLIEQQRASTQLGRTYHEMFLKSNDDHCLVRNSKRYFKAAMELAQSLKDYPTSNKSSFLKEFIDAHNNIGMLEMDLDNLEEAEKILTKGLEICDEEEVIENDDGRSRLHHNLGNVYMELRMWEEARKHIETDIIICKNIGHCQGEAKGYINLGELHYRVQRYDEATLCYKKALDLAKSMEDEDALADQIDQNIETVKEAVKVMDDLRKEEQNLKKLSRKMGMTRSLEGQQKYLIELNVSLDCLIEKSSMIFAWKKHLEFSKRKKRIAHELFDKEKMSDSYLVVGESYQKLRNFKKALKWYRKAWETYKEIGNMEGQALAKINIGDVLDCIGNWSEALEAFEAGHRIAVEADLQAVQISALENMHYSNMIRFDDVEEARRLQYLIDKLKQSKNGELDARAEVGCSDTDTECDDHSSNTRLNRSFSAVKSKPISSRSQPFNDVEELDDEMPLISLLWPDKSSAKLKKTDAENQNVSSVPTGTSPKSLSKSISNQQAVVGRKRGRVVLSDDEGEMNDGAEYMEQKIHKYSAEDVATSIERKSRSHGGRPSPFEFQDISAATSKCVVSTCIPIRLEESTCSYKSNSSNIAAKKGEYFKSPVTDEIDIVSEIAGSVSKYTQNLMHKNYGGEYDQIVTFKIDNEFIHMGIDLQMCGGELGIEFLKAEVACLYYLQLPVEKRMKGLLPVIQHMTCNGSTLESLEAFTTIKDHMREGWVEAIIDGWVQKSLMKLYIDCCEELSEAPNLKLLKKLYNLEVSEDEVIVSECELQDLSIAPLLTALHAHQTVAVLDLSHNLLGNGTMEKLRKVFTSSDKNYGGLTLDLHCNLFGPTALFQICQCPLLFARLEVLNISGNRLTDACGSYLLTILENCKALYSLNMERCSITSRTIQKIADSLDPGCLLSQLWLGYNSPLSGAALTGLLDKLANLKRFSELNLNGLKLCKPVVDSLCQLLRRTSLSGLMLGGTNIGTAGALQLTESLSNGTQDLAKLDLSLCGLTSQCMVTLNTEFPVVGCVTELNLGGNCIKQEGSTALASLLKNSHCCIRVLVLSNCHLGRTGFLCILQALAENSSLEELNLAENADTEKNFPSQTNALSSDLSRPSLNISDAPPTVCVSEKVGVDVAQLGECGMSTDCSRLEVADSEDELDGEEPAVSGFGDSSTSRQGNPSFLECQFIQKLSKAIGTAKLLLLDLSKNGFSAQVAETLYTAWSMSSARAGLCQKHIKGEIIHFSVEGVKCCKVRPCCRRD